MESVKQAVNAGTEKVQEMTSGASKEGNKQIAKDSNQSLGNRAAAAKDALGDKANESSHGAKSEAHQKAI